MTFIILLPSDRFKSLFSLTNFINNFVISKILTIFALNVKFEFNFKICKDMNYNRILRKVHYYMPRRGSADFPLPAALPSGSIKRSFFEIQSHPDTSSHA